MTIIKLIELLISKVESSTNLDDLITNLYANQDIESYSDIEKLLNVIEQSYLKRKYNNYNSNMIVGYLKKVLMQTKLTALNSLIEDTNIDKIENNGTNYDVSHTINGIKCKIINISYNGLINMINSEIKLMNDENLKSYKLYELNQLK